MALNVSPIFNFQLYNLNPLFASFNSQNQVLA